MIMHLLNLVVFILVVAVGAIQSSKTLDRPVVKTPLGQVKGYNLVSYGGRIFSAFEGIPYAKPPIGNRRFQEPEAIEPWDGIWDASFVTQCLQIGVMTPNVTEGDEDCLYINVYVPRETPKPSEKLDVIVHIHGGAYMLGSGHSYAHPEFLMDKDLIFVTFNYRLGLFGFLSTEDETVPGNNGLKDQVLALKWIQKNIASFGGNPKSVTLTGLSAGGSSVHLHFLSDMSKGLFHRGFSQSGVAINVFSLQKQPLAKAKMLANAVGCPTTDTKNMVKCLKSRHSEHLMSKINRFLGYKITPFAPFAPVVEKGTSKPFLKDNPFELMCQGHVQDLPWIASNVAHEGMFPAAFFFKNLEEVDEKWQDIAAYLLDYNYTLPKSQMESVAQKIREFYFGEDKINADNFLKLVKMFGDRHFYVDAETAVKLQARINKSPVYYYYFSYAGDHSERNLVSHGDDGQYIFFNMFQRKEISEDEIKMTEVMVDMLTSFAKTGKPVVKGVEWKPTSYDQLTYLHIKNYSTEDIKLENTTELAPRKFWKSLGFSENEKLYTIKDEL